MFAAMPETPRKVGSKVDVAIDKLNARYDLKLPRLHGVEASTAESQHSLGRKCSAKIRYLCFRPVNLDRLISEFEDEARQMFSRWIWKPSQTLGTLPSLPVTKSFIERDLRNKFASTPVQLTDTQRQELLKKLHDILDQDYQLARVTDDYQRTDGPPPSTIPITPRKKSSSYYSCEEVTTPTRPIMNDSDVSKVQSFESHLTNSGSTSSKRASDSPAHGSKRQQQIQSFFHRRPDSTAVEPDHTLGVSFETVTSAAGLSIFTNANEEDHNRESHDTSMNDSETQQTQYSDIDTENHKDAQRSFTETHQPNHHSDPTDLSRNSPFKQHVPLPPEEKFWWVWEVHRIANHLNMSTSNLHQSMRKRLPSPNPTPGEFWTTVKEVCKKQNAWTLPSKSSLKDWTTEQDRYYNKELNMIVALKARLDWSDNPADGLFKFRLNQTTVEPSCRLQRKFGADRFLVISSPDLTDCPFALKINDDKQGVHDRITEWLATTPHFIAGRWWRLFYLEQDGARKKGESPRLKLLLFAVSGFGISPSPSQDLQSFNLKDHAHHEIRLEEFYEWHLPHRANLNSTDLKLFSRWSLGLSKTAPTITLEPSEFIQVSDLLGEAKQDGHREVMNDGCALMSLALAKAIWSAIGNVGEVPSVVQGRIGGAKGLWIVDYSDRYLGVSSRGYWIEITDSQLKIKPHPAERIDADETQRTFEVLKYAQKTRNGHLNIQLITILEDAGVSRNVLKDALLADTRTFSDSLLEAIEDRPKLRLWVQQQIPKRRAGQVKLLGFFPAEKRDQVIRLLESGFKPRKCAMLIEALTALLTEYMSRYVEKLRIKLPDSTVVFCAPDPLGVLEPGEIYLGFSEPVINPQTGLSELFLDKMDVLVARNPAYLSSDIQRRTAVYYHELRHYKNVILFSTKGSTPLASLLSGGDYDGDTVTVIWDPKIVQRFRNADLPDLPSASECGMVQKSKPLGNIFHASQIQSTELNDFIQGCIKFNSTPSLMGRCSSEHEKLVYFLSLRNVYSKLTHKGAVTLASLAGHLVDANKQGWLLTIPSWYSIRRAASGSKALPDPGFKVGIGEKRNNKYVNVIDYLKFGIAEIQKEIVLSEFQRKFPKIGTYDISLSNLWNMWKDRASTEQAELKSSQSIELKGDRKGKVHQFAGGGHITLQSLLLDHPESLAKKVRAVSDKWSEMANKPGASTSFSFKDETQKKDFGTLISSIYEIFQEVEPLKADHYLRERFEDEKRYAHSFWSLLRASCLHHLICSKNQHRSWVWHVAGEELCFLKAREYGPVHLLIEEIRSAYKADAKLIKNMTESTEIYNQEDDNVASDMSDDDEEDYADAIG